MGVRNVPDIVPIGSLLEAAGISSLDETNFLTDSYRYGGVTLVVQLNYNNFGGLAYDSWKDVKYTMRVEAVRGKVKGVTAVSPTGAVPSTSRTVFERSGLRIIFTFSGDMGRPDFFSGFVAVFTIANALTWAAVAMGIFISKCLTFSPVYKAYITTKTLDLPVGADKRLADEINTLFTEHGVVRACNRGGLCARRALPLPPLFTLSALTHSLPRLSPHFFSVRATAAKGEGDPHRARGRGGQRGAAHRGRRRGRRAPARLGRAARCASAKGGRSGSARAHARGCNPRVPPGAAQRRGQRAHGAVARGGRPRRRGRVFTGKCISAPSLRGQYGPQAAKRCRRMPQCPQCGTAASGSGQSSSRPAQGPPSLPPQGLR